MPLRNTRARRIQWQVKPYHAQDAKGAQGTHHASDPLWAPSRQRAPACPTGGSALGQPLVTTSCST
eukprot:scaffold879_cov410-Prasinococcus_capsulatus_cf.AAC.32